MKSTTTTVFYSSLKPIERLQFDSRRQSSPVSDNLRLDRRRALSGGLSRPLANWHSAEPRIASNDRCCARIVLATSTIESTLKEPQFSGSLSLPVNTNHDKLPPFALLTSLHHGKTYPRRRYSAGSPTCSLVSASSVHLRLRTLGFLSSWRGLDSAKVRSRAQSRLAGFVSMERCKITQYLGFIL